MKFPSQHLYILICSLILAVPVFADNSTALCPGVTECLDRLDSGLDCRTVPVPDRARLVPIPNGQPIEIRNLRKGVWLVRDAVYNALMLRHARHLVIVDMPDSNAGFNKPDDSRTRLTDAVVTVMKGVKPRRIDMVYTHAHYDHIGAATRVFQWISRMYPKASVNIYGTTGVNYVVNTSVSKRAVVPTRIVKKKSSIVMNRRLRVDMHVLTGHTREDLAVHIPRTGSESGVLMYVDVVFPGWSPFSSVAFSEDLTGYVAVHDKLMKFDFDLFVDGHMNVGNREDIAENLRFTNDLVSAAGEGAAAVTAEEAAAAGAANFATPGSPEFGNLWFVAITVGRNLQAKKCARIMIEKWGCRFGGVAVTAESHCFSMITFRNLVF